MAMARAAAPRDENRPENTAHCPLLTAHCPLPTIFTINVGVVFSDSFHKACQIKTVHVVKGFSGNRLSSGLVPQDSIHDNS